MAVRLRLTKLSGTCLRVNAVPTSAASSNTRSLYVVIDSPGRNLGSIVQLSKTNASVASASVCATFFPERALSRDITRKEGLGSPMQARGPNPNCPTSCSETPSQRLGRKTSGCGNVFGFQSYFDVAIMNAMDEYSKELLEPSNDAHIPIRSNNKGLPARRCNVFTAGLWILTAVSDESWRGIMFAAAIPMHIRMLYRRNVTIKEKRHARASLWPSKKQHKRYGNLLES